MFKAIKKMYKQDWGRSAWWAGYILLSVGYVVVFILGTNLILGPKPVPNNDLHLAWLVSPGRFFVPVAAAPGAVETNPELGALDNPRERFLATKPPATFRIFCVGGSTTRGWPFHRKLSYPALLALYLRDLFPDKKIEVINAGMMAFDSTSDLHLITQLLEYNPDLILLYTGRNEEWTFPFHTIRRALKLHVWLIRNIRLYAFLRGRREKQIGAEFDHAQAVRDWAKARTNTGNKAELLALTGLMEKNIRLMAEKTAGKNCKMGIITQISSSRELPESSNINSINLCLKNIAFQLKLPILDLDRIFKSSKLRWDDLFIDSPPHPDASGYMLMAQSVVKWIASMGIIAPEKEWKWKNLAGEKTYLSKLGVTRTFMAGTYTRLADMEKKLGETKDTEKYRAKAFNCRNNSCR